jgi:glycosyl transferase, family 25
MRAFVINLDTATDRWSFVQHSFASSQLDLCRVPAIDAKLLSLPHRDYSEHLYRWFHGRTPNPRELACYLSHLKAIETFLATNESHGVIAEDDVVLRPDFDAVISGALRYSCAWNILRLTGLSSGHPVKVATVYGPYSLCINLARLKGAGAYVIDRRAAGALLAHMLPMRLPYDHAIDREWRWGLRAATIHPFPVSQTESDLLSSVQPGTYPKLSRTHRCLGTYPYQTLNEFSRWLSRGLYSLRLRLFPLRVSRLRR